MIKIDRIYREKNKNKNRNSLYYEFRIFDSKFERKIIEKFSFW